MWTCVTWNRLHYWLLLCGLADALNSWPVTSISELHAGQSARIYHLPLNFYVEREWEYFREGECGWENLFAAAGWERDQVCVPAQVSSIVAGEGVEMGKGRGWWLTVLVEPMCVCVCDKNKETGVLNERVRRIVRDNTQIESGPEFRSSWGHTDNSKTDVKLRVTFLLFTNCMAVPDIWCFCLLNNF